ncbi:MAG: polyhydroxyalkanoate synthesis regulator DNA-binding domain-containing protein [Isosphaeraceae bacterium]
MSDAKPVEIRRYPNRRFYDRSRRRYVTLQEIEELVLDGRTIEVTDSRSGEDLTRQVLTQLLMERQPHKMDMFPIGLLHQILRANDMVIDLYRGYLRQSLASMEALRNSGGTYPFASPMGWMSAMLSATNPAGAEPTASADPEAPDMAERIRELTRRIERLEGGPAKEPDGPEGAPSEVPVVRKIRRG